MTGLYKEVHSIDGPNEAEIILDGKRVINLFPTIIWDLQIIRDWKEAAKRAIDNYGGCRRSSADYREYDHS